MASNNLRNSEIPPHAVLVPGPGLGHINGMLSLSRALLQVGFRLTIVYFARVHAAHSARGVMPPVPSPTVKVEVLPDGLEPSESYMDIFIITPIMHASLRQLLSRLLEQRSAATCIVADAFMAWTHEVASEIGIPRIEYWTASASSYLCILAYPDLKARGFISSQDRKHDGAEPILLDGIPGLPEFRVSDLPIDRGFSGDLDSHPILKLLLEAARVAKHADRVLIHTVHALESVPLEDGFRPHGIAAFAVGPLIDLYVTGSDMDCFRWLDGQPPSSVIYVAFGSNVAISDAELLELAHGLEASCQPFLWVIRKDMIGEGKQLSDILPSGFASRTKDKGLIISWAPQIEVLAHPAVGGFLTHCGWNSILESLSMGKPMIVWPQAVDQFYNARLVADIWKVGMRLNIKDMAQSVIGLLRADEGKQFKANVQNLSVEVRKAARPGGRSFCNLLKFVEDMKARHPLRQTQ